MVNAVLDLLLSMLGRCKVVGCRQRNCPWSIAKSAAHSVALTPVDISIVTEPMPLCSSPLYRAQPSLSFRAKTNATCLPIVPIMVSSHSHTPYSSVQSLALLLRHLKPFHSSPIPAIRPNEVSPSSHPFRCPSTPINASIVCCTPNCGCLPHFPPSCRTVLIESRCPLQTLRSFLR